MPIKFRSSGFTLVELLIVVTLIIVLSGITLSVVNVSGQRNRAQDELRRSNLKSLAEGIEVFRIAEGNYPASETDTRLAPYISIWPNDKPEEGDLYLYARDGTGLNFGLYVAREVDTQGYKYRSEWKEVRLCTDSSPSGTTC